MALLPPDVRDETLTAKDREEQQDRELVLLLFRVEHELSRAMWPTLAPYGLTRPQAGALQQLRTYGPSSMRDLAARLYCDASNVTGIVDRLEARALVTRLAHPSDRRVKQIALTEDGAAVADEMWEMAATGSVVMNLPAPTKRRLHEALRAVFAEASFDSGEPSI